MASDAEWENEIEKTEEEGVGGGGRGGGRWIRGKYKKKENERRR